MVGLGICLRQIVIHAEAVQIAPALAEVVLSDLHPVLGGIHVAEIPKTFFVEIGESTLIYSLKF